MKNIIADENLVSLFKSLVPSEVPNLTLVQLEMLDHRGDRSKYPGLARVLELPVSQDPVIMLAFSPTNFLAYDKRYHAAVARPNVVYGQLPLRASDIPGLIAQANTRPPDPLAVDLVYAEVESNALSILKHNLPYLEAKDEAFRAEWLSLAKSMFGNLLLDELTKSVQQADLTPKPGIFAGRFYEDVCVDVEGTLVDKNGKLQPEVVNLVIQLAETYPITLWTGGNVANAERQIRELGISRKITAKQLMRGATVSMVIDDMPQAEFDSEYGVLYTHYKRI